MNHTSYNAKAAAQSQQARKVVWIKQKQHMERKQQQKQLALNTTQADNKLANKRDRVLRYLYWEVGGANKTQVERIR